MSKTQSIMAHFDIGSLNVLGLRDKKDMKCLHGRMLKIYRLYFYRKHIAPVN